MSTKATFALDDAVLHEVREYVKENRLKSLSAFVERALREELRRLQQERIRKSLLAAGDRSSFPGGCYGG